MHIFEHIDPAQDHLLPLHSVIQRILALFKLLSHLLDFFGSVKDSFQSCLKLFGFRLLQVKLLKLLVKIFEFHFNTLNVRLSDSFGKNIGLKSLHALNDISDLDLALALQVTQVKLLLLLLDLGQASLLLSDLILHLNEPGGPARKIFVEILLSLPLSLQLAIE